MKKLYSFFFDLFFGLHHLYFSYRFKVTDTNELTLKINNIGTFADDITDTSDDTWEEKR